MGKLLNIITPLHKKTSRDYVGRMTDSKVECMKVARRYGPEFWDGDRRYGYGGHKYDGRWEAVASAFIDLYGLGPNARILDVGCGKGFLLHEFKKLLPACEVVGFDISEYAMENAKEDVRPYLFTRNARGPYPFGDKHFDLVVSVATLYNLHIYELEEALKEIERVGKNKYLLMESYNDDQQLFNLQCWALTCECFFKPEEWIWLYGRFGYTGDYEFIYFD